jgi:hypothetical protein
MMIVVLALDLAVMILKTAKVEAPLVEAPLVEAPIYIVVELSLFFKTIVENL